MRTNIGVLLISGLMMFGFVCMSFPPLSAFAQKPAVPPEEVLPPAAPEVPPIKVPPKPKPKEKEEEPIPPTLPGAREPVPEPTEPRDLVSLLG